jgi:peptide/nickel transport system permease protein
LRVSVFLRLPLVLAAVAWLTFFLTYLIPGDAALAILGPEATKEQLDAFREAEGLNDPIFLRFFSWLWDLFRGDLGQSIKYGENVVTLIGQRIPVTIELALLAQTLALLIAIPLAAFSAYRSGKALDRLVSSGSFVLLSLPNFIFGLLFVYIFSIQLGWLPSSGFVSLSESVGENLKSMIMPTIVAAVGPIAVYTRVLRSDMVSTLSENFILLARSQGVPPFRILFRYALRPSALGLVTLIGLNFGVLLGGAVVVEQLYALPGLGSLLVGSVAAKDFAVVQGITLLIASIYVLLNFFVDRIYTLIDPRIRIQNG